MIRTTVRLFAVLPLVLVAAAVASESSARAQCETRVSDSPIARETALLKGLVAEGWMPTAAGKGLLAGRGLPPPTRRADGTVRAEGGVQLAIAPEGVTPTRALQTVKRRMITVFLYCGVGQQGNVNFYVPASTYAYVNWGLHNLSTGAAKTTRSAGTNYCPAGTGGCLEYFYLAPAAPWFVWSADERNLASPLNEYCSP